MKKYLLTLIALALLRPCGAPAQTNDEYAADIAVVLGSQKEAIDQAKQAIEHANGRNERSALESAIKEMERSQKELEAAKSAPDKLPAALASEQAAYQDLLKATPREYRMRRSRPGQGQGQSGSGQPNQEEMNQLEMKPDTSRYETESQASPAQTATQKEQSETLDRLKQLARRQQDLNERLRDLQTALEEAKTDQEREDIQRQLKRLRDEERQMLADVDEMRQKMEQSPNADRQAQARQKLEQTRNDVQKASQALDGQSVSQALASGSRAEEKLQDLREDLRQQTSSQFAEQMKQMRQQARDLAEGERKIGEDLDKLTHSDEKSLDDSGPRQSVVDQMAKQKTSLTNLLARMRDVTEQSESTEPLLSKQLYDTVRRTDQAHTESQLEAGGQLAERGFLPQASQAEQAARTSIEQLSKDVDRAAASVLGSEADALRYAQKELDKLTGELGKDLSKATNNATGQRPNGGEQQAQASQTNEGAGTNETAQAGQPRAVKPGERGAPNERGEQARSGQSAQGQQGEGGRGGQPGEGKQTAQAQGQGQQPDQSAQAGRAGQGGQSNNGNASNSTSPANANGQSLSDFARQLGASGGAGGLGENGPITGNNYVDWTERLRDVEQSVDSPDIRNQLATVRERVGVFRRFYRQNGRMPTKEELQSKALAPLSLARNWVAQELARTQNDHSLVPLDRDPAPEKYSELVRKYYENLGASQ